MERLKTVKILKEAVGEKNKANVSLLIRLGQYSHETQCVQLIYEQYFIIFDVQVTIIKVAAFQKKKPAAVFIQVVQSSKYIKYRKSLTQLILYLRTFTISLHFLHITAYINLQIASWHKTKLPHKNNNQEMLKINRLISDEDVFSKRSKNTIEIRKGNRDDIFKRRRLIHIGRDGQLDEQGNAVGSIVVLDERLRNETVNYASMDFVPNDLERLLKDIDTDDLMMKLHGAIGLKKIFSCDGEIPIKTLQAPKVVIKLLLLAKDQKWPQIQYEGLCALVNFTSFKTGDSFHIIDQGGLSIIINALSSSCEQIVQQGLWALENICIDHFTYRDRILKTDAVDKVIQLAVENSDKKILDECCSLLSSLCRGKPLPEYQDVKKILNTLCFALTEGLIESPIIVSDCLWAISYHCQGIKNQHECVIQSNLLFQILKIIKQTKEPQFLVPCARIIGNISSGDKKCTEIMFNSGIIETLFIFLNSDKKILRREACWTLSNLAATDAKQIVNIYGNVELMNKLSDLFKRESHEIKREICLILENMATIDTNEPLEEIYIRMGFIETYAEILSSVKEPVSLLKVALQSLIEILRFSLERKIKTKVHVNMLVDILQQERFMRIIENLQVIDNNQIYDLTYAIMCCCFEVTELYELSPPEQKKTQLKIDCL